MTTFLKTGISVDLTLEGEFLFIPPRYFYFCFLLRQSIESFQIEYMIYDDIKEISNMLDFRLGYVEECV